MRNVRTSRVTVQSNSSLLWLSFNSLELPLKLLLPSILGLLWWLFEGTVAGQISIEDVLERISRFGPRVLGPKDRIRCNKEFAWIRQSIKRERMKKKKGRKRNRRRKSIYDKKLD